MQPLVITTATYRYATFRQRLAASIIDTLICFIVFSPTVLLIDVFYAASFSDSKQWELIQQIILLVVSCVYWRKYGASPGKLLLNIRVVNLENSQQLSVMTCVMRYIAYSISLLPLGLGFLWMLWDKNKQCWHDKIAKTAVIQLNVF